MTEWDYIFERDWNKYSINAILERKKMTQRVFDVEKEKDMADLWIEELY